MKGLDIHTCTQALFLHLSQKQNLLFLYTRVQRWNRRLVCKREQGLPSMPRPNEAGTGKGNG